MNSLCFRKSERMPCLNSEKVAGIEKELEVMQTKQAYFGLIDNIEWVLKMTRDPTSSLEDLEHFFTVMIRDNLYTEHWLHWFYCSSKRATLACHIDICRLQNET